MVLTKHNTWFTFNLLLSFTDIFSLFFCRTPRPVINIQKQMCHSVVLFRHQVISLNCLITVKFSLAFHNETWWFSFAAQAKSKDMVDYVRFTKPEQSSIQVCGMHLWLTGSQKEIKYLFNQEFLFNKTLNISKTEFDNYLILFDIQLKLKQFKDNILHAIGLARLLAKPKDTLCFRIQHKGSHKKISVCDKLSQFF